MLRQRWWRIPSDCRKTKKKTDFPTGAYAKHTRRLLMPASCTRNLLCTPCTRAFVIFRLLVISHCHGVVRPRLSWRPIDNMSVLQNWEHGAAAMNRAEATPYFRSRLLALQKHWYKWQSHSSVAARISKISPSPAWCTTWSKVKVYCHKPDEEWGPMIQNFFIDLLEREAVLLFLKCFMHLHIFFLGAYHLF